MGRSEGWFTNPSTGQRAWWDGTRWHPAPPSPGESKSEFLKSRNRDIEKGPSDKAVGYAVFAVAGVLILFALLFACASSLET